MKITLKQLVYFEMIYTVFMMQWMTYFGISNIKVLVPDAINIAIFLVGYNTLMHGWSDRKVRSFTGWVAIFWIITFFTSIFGEMISGGISGVLLAIWNMRTFLRPFFYMLICYTYFEKSDLDTIFDIAYKLQFVNVGLSLFQYYIQNIWMDQNGGMFAPVQGCNKFSNIYCCIMMAWVLARYLRENGSIQQIATTFIAAVVTAIYSELKFLFIEMIIVTILCVLFSGGGKRLLRTLMIGILVLIFGLFLLMNLFPESFQFLSDFELLMWYARDMSYSQTEVSVNRLSGISVVNKYMFNNDPYKTLFGFGWGATSQIPFLGMVAPIMQAFRNLFFVTFTYSWVYAELGMIGLILFYAVLASVFISISRYSNSKSEYVIISKTMCILTVMLTVYDSSWVTEGTSFMCALAMIAGLVAAKEEEYDR